MGRPLMLAESFFNPIQFPGHVVIGDAETPGFEGFNVGTARRSKLVYYTDTNPGSEGRVTVVCDRVREADTLVMDRNSDIGGRVFWLQGSSDNFLSTETIFTGTIGLDVVLGSSLNGPVHAIATNESAVAFHFEPRAYKYWRIRMQASVIPAPRAGGVYLGKSFTPEFGARLPWDDESSWSDFKTVRRGVPDNDWRFGREVTLNMMLNGEAEWNELRKIRELAKRGHPIWTFPDSDYAERGGLYYLEGGTFSAPISERPQGRSVSLSLVEYDPELK